MTLTLIGTVEIGPPDAGSDAEPDVNGDGVLQPGFICKFTNAMATLPSRDR